MVSSNAAHQAHLGDILTKNHLFLAMLPVHLTVTDYQGEVDVTTWSHPVVEDVSSLPLASAYTSKPSTKVGYQSIGISNMQGMDTRILP